MQTDTRAGAEKSDVPAGSGQLSRTRPRRIAVAIASVRLVTPSFSKRWVTWIFPPKSGPGGAIFGRRP